MYPFLLLFDLCFFQVFQKKKNQIYGPSIVVAVCPFLYNCVNISN